MSLQFTSLPHIYTVTTVVLYMTFRMKAYLCAVLPSPNPVHEDYTQNSDKQPELLFSISFSLLNEGNVYQSSYSYYDIYVKI